MPCMMMALNSFRCTMPISKKPAYSAFMARCISGAVAVAVILRRLHEADARIGEHRHQILEPVGFDHVVGIDDADDFGVGRGVRERDAQRAGLKAGEILDPDEFEALAERGAMLLDRPPQGRIGRIVDHQHAFEVRDIRRRATASSVALSMSGCSQ